MCNLRDEKNLDALTLESGFLATFLSCPLIRFWWNGFDLCVWHETELCAWHLYYRTAVVETRNIHLLLYWATRWKEFFHGTSDTISNNDQLYNHFTLFRNNIGCFSSHRISKCIEKFYWVRSLKYHMYGKQNERILLFITIRQQLHNKFRQLQWTLISRHIRMLFRFPLQDSKYCCRYFISSLYFNEGKWMHWNEDEDISVA